MRAVDQKHNYQLEWPNIYIYILIISKSDPGKSGVAGTLPMAQIVATKYWVDKPT